MTSKEYIETCKIKLNVDSYYKLAKKLEISESDLSFYIHGKRTASVYACFKFGECLGIDPAIIIADIASESEKNPIKRGYFKAFMSSCMKAMAGLIIITALGNTTDDGRALSA